MPTPAIELQHAALDRTVRVSDLLRMALVIARRLGDDEAAKWISHELTGRPAGEEWPKYRILPARPVFLDPRVGLVWLPTPDPRLASLLSKWPCGSTVAEIESILDRPANDGVLVVPAPAETERMIREILGIEDLLPRLYFRQERAGLWGILDAVRTRVLEWTTTLNLEDVPWRRPRHRPAGDR